MKILVTGAFGNIGKLLINELIERNYSVKCFVLPSVKNKKIVQKIKETKGCEIFYGDTRKKEDIKLAIKDCKVVIHLAFTSPKICQKNPSFAYKVNIEGTNNLIEVIKKNSKNIKIIFASSISAYLCEIYKKSKKIKLLRYIEYAKHKLECEKIIESSPLSWCILRIGAILPIRFPNLNNLFDISYDTRFEFIHMKDTITALINAIKTERVVGKVLLIGGGRKFCMKYGNFVNDLFRIANREFPKKSDFTPRSYLTSCFNTTESQKILKYQKHSYKDFLEEMRR